MDLSAGDGPEAGGQKSDAFQDNRLDCTEENEQLRSQIEDLRAKNRTLQEKLDNFTERMGKAMDIQIGSSGLLSEDLKNPCRESELKNRYNKLRQNDWAEFLGKLKKSRSHNEQQQKESSDLKKDAQKVFKCTLKEAESNMQELIKKLKELLHLDVKHSSNTKTLQHFDLAIQQIQMAILHKEQIPEDLIDQKLPDLKPLVLEAYKIGCLMALHNPPILLDWANQKGTFPECIHDLKAAGQNMTTPTAVDSKEARPDGHTPNATNSKDAAPDGNTPNATDSKDARPDGHTPNATDSKEARPDGHTPNATDSKEARPDGHTPNATNSKDAAPDGNTPNATNSEDAAPDGNTPNALNPNVNLKP
uniref:Uncharacterized protein n=1 Tax=Pygocentrus nattereri TaxID=42514 RepID=A0AAR2KH43_PYGNA